MMIVVTILHVLACIVLVLSVLLQAGKGAEMGAVFGGASTTIFGGSGAGNFLTRITTAAAVVFMLTSLTLTYGPQRTGTSTVMPESAPAPGTAAPAGGALDDAAAPPLDAAPPLEAAPPNAAPADAAPATANAIPETAPVAAAPAGGAANAPAGDNVPPAAAPAPAADAGVAGGAGGGQPVSTAP